jgi:FAD/FMN-containing dehydrogenase
MASVRSPDTALSEWSNWSGRHTARPEDLHFLRSEPDAAALAASVAASGGSLRAAGAGHSHAPLVPTEGTIADISGLAGVIDIDTMSREAWVYAGTPIHALGRALHDQGLALHNQGDIDRQAIAGATATGTHGTGATLANLSSAVTGMRIALANGALVDCDLHANADLWRAARLHLGAFGLVTRLKLRLREACVLEEHAERLAFDAVMADLDERVARHRHFEFFWYPGNDTAFAKWIDESDVMPDYPLAAEGARIGWSHEVLPNHRPHKHTEMEYSVPAASGPDCLREIRALIRTDFPAVRWPVEYRTLAADDVWLSTARDRATVTISVHEDIANDERAYYQACERIFRAFDGRPHWGKLHHLDGDTLGRIHPDWTAWWAVRDEVDPAGVFLNAHLEAMRPR